MTCCCQIIRTIIYIEQNYELIYCTENKCACERIKFILTEEKL